MQLTRKIVVGLSAIALWGCFGAYNLNLSIAHNRCWQQEYARIKVDYDQRFGTLDQTMYAFDVLLGPLATPGVLGISGHCHRAFGLPA